MNKRVISIGPLQVEIKWNQIGFDLVLLGRQTCYLQVNTVTTLFIYLFIRWQAYVQAMSGMSDSQHGCLLNVN